MSPNIIVSISGLLNLCTQSAGLHAYVINLAQVNLHGIQNRTVVKAKHEVRVNSCLLSSNKSRPHLSTYVDLIKGRKGVVLVRALELKCQSWNDSGIWHFEE